MLNPKVTIKNFRERDQEPDIIEYSRWSVLSNVRRLSTPSKILILATDDHTTVLGLMNTEAESKLGTLDMHWGTVLNQRRLRNHFFGFRRRNTSLQRCGSQSVVSQGLGTCFYRDSVPTRWRWTWQLRDSVVPVMYPGTPHAIGDGSPLKWCSYITWLYLEAGIRC